MFGEDKTEIVSLDFDGLSDAGDGWRNNIKRAALPGKRFVSRVSGYCVDGEYFD